MSYQDGATPCHYMSASGGHGEGNHPFQVVDGHDYLIVGTFARVGSPYCQHLPIG